MKDVGYRIDLGLDKVRNQVVEEATIKGAKSKNIPTSEVHLQKETKEIVEIPACIVHRIISDYLVENDNYFKTYTLKQSVRSLERKDEHTYSFVRVTDEE